MGIFLISNLPFVFRKPKEVKFKGRQSNLLLMIIGFLAGALSGLTGAVGLLFNKFYLRHGLTKDQIIATRAANEITLHLIKIISIHLIRAYNHSGNCYWIGGSNISGSFIRHYEVDFTETK